MLLEPLSAVYSNSIQTELAFSESNPLFLNKQRLETVARGTCWMTKHTFVIGDLNTYGSASPNGLEKQPIKKGE